MPNDNEDSILAAMKTKKRMLEAAIASYEASLRGTEIPLGDGSQESGNGTGSTDVPNGAFNGLTIPAAVKLYLKIVNKKQTTADIVAGLKKGEMESTAKNFYKLVSQTLTRLWKVKRELIKTGEHWALPEFFSPQVRASLTATEPVPKKQKLRAKKKAAKKTRSPRDAAAPQTQETKPTAPAADSTQPPASDEAGSRGRISAAGKERISGAVKKRWAKYRASKVEPDKAEAKAAAPGGVVTRIEAILQEHPDRGYTIPEMAAAAEIDVKAAQLALANLVGRKKAEKTENGKYRAARRNPQPTPMAAAS